MKIGLNIFPGNFKNVDEILFFSVSWELMLSRRTQFGGVPFNFQVFFTSVLKRKILQSFHIIILALKSENSAAECSCVLMKADGKHFPVAKILCKRLKLYLLSQ